MHGCHIEIIEGKQLICITEIISNSKPNLRLSELGGHWDTQRHNSKLSLNMEKEIM
jgi:hypothetical protein